MTPTEFRTALLALGLSQSGAARFMGLHEGSGRRWAVEGPPAPVAKFLAYMVAAGLTPATVDATLEEKPHVAVQD